MKARTKILLQAADAALRGECAVILIDDNEEYSVWGDMCNHIEFMGDRDLRCLYLCFLAAANETGDL